MNDKITLQELVELFAQKCQLEQADAALFVKEFLNLIEEALTRDKYVKVKGLGTFKLISIEARKSVDVNTGESIEIKGHARVSFIPEAGLRDLINKPFAHFQSVLLKDEVHFDDLPEEGGLPEGEDDGLDADMAEETVESVREEFQPETVVPPVTEQSEEAKMETAPVSSAQDLPEKENAEDASLPAEDVTSAEMEQPGPEKKEAEAAVASVKEEKESVGDEVVTNRKVESPSTESAGDVPVSVEKEQEKERHIPWCMIASILLVGIFIGWLVTWALTSGRRYIPEEVVEYLMTHEQPQRKVPVLPDSLKVTDTVTVRTDTSRNQAVQTPDTVIPVAKGKEPLPAGRTEKNAAVPVKRETLADTVEYQITGTQTSYTIQPGESLVRVALKFYGNKKLWPYLVKHNKSVIKNPDNVPVGTVIQIPQLTPKK